VLLDNSTIFSPYPGLGRLTRSPPKPHYFSKNVSEETNLYAQRLVNGRRKCNSLTDNDRNWINELRREIGTTTKRSSEFKTLRTALKNPLNGFSLLLGEMVDSFPVPVNQTEQQCVMAIKGLCSSVNEHAAPLLHPLKDPIVISAFNTVLIDLVALGRTAMSFEDVKNIAQQVAAFRVSLGNYLHERILTSKNALVALRGQLIAIQYAGVGKSELTK
jgi:hypothetical protein